MKKMKEDQPDTHDERAWRFCRTQHNRRRDWTRFGIVLNSLRRLSHRQIAPLTTVAQRLPGWGQSLPRFRSELAIVFKVSLYVNEVFLFSLSGKVSTGGQCQTCSETGKVANGARTFCESCLIGKEPSRDRSECVCDATLACWLLN